jgi:hypothetical protein
MGVGTNIQARATRTPRSACTATSSKEASTLMLADGRAQSEVHQSDHPRPARRPRDRGHRRHALSFAEVKAFASGDPLILDHAQANAELTRLTRLEHAR